MQQHCEHSNKPASELIIVLNDGSTHVFDWAEVADVLRVKASSVFGLLSEAIDCDNPCLHESTDSVQQTRLTDFGDHTAEEWEEALFGPVEAQESPRRSLVGIHPGRGNNGTFSHCSRCRSPHRRAHIKRVAHNGHVTMRCFDCQHTGNQKSADLKAVRQALFDAETRFVRGSQYLQSDIRSMLYNTEKNLSGFGSTAKLRGLMALAGSLDIPVPGVEL